MSRRSTFGLHRPLVQVTDIIQSIDSNVGYFEGKCREKTGPEGDFGICSPRSEHL